MTLIKILSRNIMTKKFEKMETKCEVHSFMTSRNVFNSFSLKVLVKKTVVYLVCKLENPRKNLVKFM